MSDIKLEPVAESQGPNCTIKLLGVKWGQLKLFFNIEKVEEDADSLVVFDVPPTNSASSPSGCLSTTLKNSCGWKGVKLVCNEPVRIVGNDEVLSILAGKSSNPVAQVIRASSEKVSMKGAVRIEQ